MPAALVFALLVAPASPLDASLDRVPERRAEWKALVAKSPAAERAAMTYLLSYMPLDDLKTLPTARVGAWVHEATVARKSTSWGKKVPEAVYLDAVVPYASVTETRRSMRETFMAKYLPVAKRAKTPGEAALAIHRTLFKDYPVVYNTRRLKTDQSAPESIAQGMATCTGLSIMLVDALRAVGVPSRLAGIPSWPGRGGNHTWVEVWDTDGWHFVGAAEPDDKGLDHAWFAEEAGTVPGTKPSESIYAATYRPTGTEFPMVWNDTARVPALNVTAHYQKSLAKKEPRLMVEVKQDGERVMAEVIAVNAANGDQCLKGQSLGPQADMNLHLSAPAKEGETYVVKATYDGETVTREVKVAGDTVVRIDLNRRALVTVLATLPDRFGDDAIKRNNARKALETLPFNGDYAQAAWNAYLAAPNAAMKADFDANTVKTADRTSPYHWRTVGTKPKDGWGLVIAMHGGGGAPKSVNDGEWAHMFKAYYKDHPEAGGYVYLALRAPNDEWDGFYDTPIAPLIERLILQFVKYGEVDPNRVYAMGASHGGYGTFVIGPKVPYRFAALHPAAGAETPGRTAGENLRNVRFTWAVGENDAAYGRIKLDREFGTKWDGWKAQYGGFDGGLEEIKGHGHLIGDTEADKIAEMRKYARDAAPKRVIWTQTDDVLHRFYWLEALKPVDKGHIEADVVGNVITLKTTGQGEVALWLSSALVDLSKPVTVIRDGVKKEFRVKPSLATYCDGLEATGDPFLAAPVRIVVP